MITQTTTKQLGQVFYFYHILAPGLSDVQLKLYNTSNTLIVTLNMSEISTTGVYKVGYIAPAVGTYVGISSSQTAIASIDDVVRARSTSVTELTIIPVPETSSTGQVTISNSVGVGVKCD